MNTLRPAIMIFRDGKYRFLWVQRRTKHVHIPTLSDRVIWLRDDEPNPRNPFTAPRFGECILTLVDVAPGGVAIFTERVEGKPKEGPDCEGAIEEIRPLDLRTFADEPEEK